MVFENHACVFHFYDYAARIYFDSLGRKSVMRVAQSANALKYILRITRKVWHMSTVLVLSLASMKTKSDPQMHSPNLMCHEHH